MSIKIKGNRLITINKITNFRFNYFLATLLLNLFNLSIFSQQFPVQIIANSSGPIYSTELRSFANEKFHLSLFINDSNIINSKLKLSVKIEGAGIQINTAPNITPSILTIDTGSFKKIEASYLLQFFNPEHLTFSGLDRNEYIRTGFLPSGIYTFSFQVLDYIRNIRVSNTSSVSVQMISSEYESGQIKILKLFPNPVNDLLNVMFELDEIESVNISIDKINGTATSVNYKQNGFKNYNIEMNMKDFEPGIYFFKIISKGESKVKKIIVQ